MLRRVIQEKGLSVYECARKSGIPYMTLSDLINNKTDLKKCSVDTLYRLCKTLNISMDLVVDSYYNTPTTDFEAFRSSVQHLIKSKGELPFLLETIKNDVVRQIWKEDRYEESFYLLAMIDYLLRKNNIPLVTDYDDIRINKLLEPLYPRDVNLIDKLFPERNIKEDIQKNSIPEFSKFNIFETEIFDVYWFCNNQR